MNERVRKYFISAMALCCSLLLVFPFCMRNVNAEVSSLNLAEDNPVDVTNISDLLKEFPDSGVIDITGYYNNTAFSRWRIRLSNNTSVSDIMNPPSDLFLLTFKEPNSSYIYALLFRTGFPDSDKNNHLADGYGLMIDGSNDGVNWTYYGYLTNYGSPYYTGSGLDGYAFPISYRNYYNNSYFQGIPNYPHINLLSGQNINTILQVISYRLESRPWGVWSDSSGGLHFQNGTEMDSEDRSKYEQIYIVMDVNNDNSVSEAEVYYYNATYNTNYDYSEINNGDNFTELQFLEYIALLLSQGIENPGGGTGDGGGSGSVGGGGITVTDSFTQSQSQTIEENAVNVTVNNNNSLSQENVQTLENFIELNLGEQQENAFAEAVGGISRFIGVGQAFAGLVTAVLGFLPAWTITLLGVLFTIIFVMIVFRLLHVFL